ncbi:MAG TPA: aminotransferase class V-fold PLP-dependent enzyme, partial [Gemmatimonadaceae bacterium]
DKLGMSEVRKHEQMLTSLATERLLAVPDVRVYGPPPSLRSGVVSFTVGDIHPHDISTILDEDGVCIRAGHHCAQPLMRRLHVPATARASFYVYNTEADVDALVAGVERAREVFGA